MATKTSIIAKIREYLSLNATKTTRAEHEEFLYNSADSIVESVYGDPVEENTGGTLAITTPGNFSYNLRFQKMGRAISLSGNFTATDIIAPGDTIATITDTDWIARTIASNGTAHTQAGETIQFYILGNELRIGVTVTAPETFYINTLIYNSEN
jgi:hypothetical protein